MAATRLSFSYPENLKEKLTALAENAEGGRRTLSSYVQNILITHIEENEEKIKVKKVDAVQTKKKSRRKVKK